MIKCSSQSTEPKYRNNSAFSVEMKPVAHSQDVQLGPISIVVGNPSTFVVALANLVVFGLMKTFTDHRFTPGLSARDMFQEICRCWKCRYLHHYDTNAVEAPLQQESYVQTSLSCNPPLNCAEDIVQSQCAALRPVGWVGPAITSQPVANPPGIA